MDIETLNKATKLDSLIKAKRNLIDEICKIQDQENNSLNELLNKLQDFSWKHPFSSEEEMNTFYASIVNDIMNRLSELKECRMIEVDILQNEFYNL